MIVVYNSRFSNCKFPNLNCPGSFRNPGFKANPEVINLYFGNGSVNFTIYPFFDILLFIVTQITNN